MSRPEITDDQREIAIELMANALRKDAHVRARAHRTRGQVDILRASLVRNRAEPSQRYVEGMRDMLRVLFPHGHAIAEECMDAAFARAMGVPRHNEGASNRTDH